MRCLLLPVFIAIGGCAPHTGDDLVDRVILKVAPFTSCVRVGQTKIFKISDEPGPPALLLPTSFNNREARLAAARIAIRWQTANDGDTAFLGRGSPDNCRTFVGRPAYSANFAFVTFSEPGGTLGAYSFHYREGTWREDERVALGHW